MPENHSKNALPDWWQRERRRRQSYFLILLAGLITLIGYYYWDAYRGGVQTIDISFDTSDTIAYVHRDSTGAATLYAARANGSDKPRRLTRPEDISTKQDPAWTIDGTRLLYSSNRNDAKSWQIFILGHGDPRQLTYGAGNKYAPLASPDRKYAAFVTQGAIKTVLLNGRDVYQVLPPPIAGNEPGAAVGMSDPANILKGSYLNAAFSSDGRGVAGVEELNGEENPVALGGLTVGDQGVFAVSPAGEKAELLNMGHDMSVCWDPAPHSAKLVCAFSGMMPAGKKKPADALSGLTLWDLTDPQRPRQQPLLLAPGDALELHGVTWSPDGSQLAMEAWLASADTNRTLLGIIVLDFHGLEARPVSIASEAQARTLPLFIKSTPDAQPLNPHFSPDGRRISFEMARKDGGHDIWVVNNDGTNRVNLTKGDGDNTQPAWSPSRAK